MNTYCIFFNKIPPVFIYEGLKCCTYWKVAKLTTDLYVKSANKHQCLHYTLSHSDSIKRSIVYSQVVTDNIGYRICFKKSDFQMHMFELKSWFLDQVCLLKYFENDIREFKFVKPMKLRKGFP